MYSIYIQKSKCYIVPLYDCKFWQLEGADPIYTVYIWKPSKLQRLLFQNNDREIQDTFRFLRIIACLQIAVEEDNDSLKKRMSMHKPHSSSLCSLSDCVCNCVLARICGESDMSEMHVLCVRIPPNLDNWARWPISSSADAVIQRQDTSTLYNALCKEKFETNLHQTPSSYKRLQIRRSSPDCLQQQLLTHSPWAFWCRAKRHFHASFGRTRGVAPQPLHENFRNQTATASALCSEIASAEISLKEMHRKNHEPSPHLYYWVCFFFISLSSLKQIQRQKCFASSMLPSLLEYVGITSWKNQTCLAHGQVYSLPSCHSLPWQPPKHDNSASQKSDALDALD